MDCIIPAYQLFNNFKRFIYVKPIISTVAFSAKWILLVCLEWISLVSHAIGSLHGNAHSYGKDHTSMLFSLAIYCPTQNIFIFTLTGGRQHLNRPAFPVCSKWAGSCKRRQGYWWLWQSPSADQIVISRDDFTQASTRPEKHWAEVAYSLFG